jgi:hypothetical protein
MKSILIVFLLNPASFLIALCPMLILEKLDAFFTNHMSLVVFRIDFPHNHSYLQ